ncbi:MAG: hypothetical protein AAF600_04595 [Bacteroidota bacterium]
MIFLHQEYKPINRPTLDGKIPDMIITKNNKIEAVIELKCKPWDSVKYEDDLQKLKYFGDLSLKNTQIPLSWPPISSNWKIQIASNKGEKYYQFQTDCLLVFGVIAIKGANALSKLDNHGIENFLNLKHFIENNYVK